MPRSRSEDEDDSYTPDDDLRNTAIAELRVDDEEFRKLDDAVLHFRAAKRGSLIRRIMWKHIKRFDSIVRDHMDGIREIEDEKRDPYRYRGLSRSDFV